MFEFLKKSQNDAIKKAIELVNCNFLVSNKSVPTLYKQVRLIVFNQTLIFFSNYIPNKLITVNEKDPPWMNESVKKKIMVKKYTYENLSIPIVRATMPT